MKKFLAAALSGLVAIVLAPHAAWSQSKPEFIPFQGRAKGALYRPDAATAPHVGILVMHRTAREAADLMLALVDESP